MKKYFLIPSLFILPIGCCFYMSPIFKSLIGYTGESGSIAVKKDETRFNSTYYGINWGSRTDEMIENKIETGDILVFKKNSWISKLKEINFIGKYMKSHELLGENDNVGVILRTQGGVYVCYVNNFKLLQIVPYNDFLSDKRHRYIKLRIKDIFAKENETMQNNFKDNLTFFEKIKNNPHSYNDSIELLLEYFRTTKICSNIENKKLNPVDTNFPLCLSPKDSIYKYSRTFVIRSNNS